MSSCLLQAARTAPLKTITYSLRSKKSAEFSPTNRAITGEMLGISGAAAGTGKQHLPSGRGCRDQPIDNRPGRRQESAIVDRCLDRIARLDEITDDRGCYFTHHELDWSGSGSA